MGESVYDEDWDVDDLRAKLFDLAVKSYRESSNRYLELLDKRYDLQAPFELSKQEILRIQANRYQEGLDNLLDFIYRLKEKEI